MPPRLPQKKNSNRRQKIAGKTPLQTISKYTRDTAKSSAKTQQQIGVLNKNFADYQKQMTADLGKIASNSARVVAILESAISR